MAAPVQLPTLLMKRNAKVFQYSVFALGMVLLAEQFSRFRLDRPAVFLSYLGVLTLLAYLRVGLPTVAGTMSVGFLVILTAIVQLPMPETLALGCAAALFQALPPRGGVMNWRLAGFQTGVAAIGIRAAAWAYASAGLHGGPMAALPAAALTLFLVTAFPLAAFSALLESRPMREIWRERYLWSLPYYLAGGGLAGLLAESNHLPVWRVAVFAAPLLYLVYRAFDCQVEQVERERRYAEELNELQLGMVEALALSYESNYGGEYRRARRMMLYTTEIGRELGVGEVEMQALRAAALLHDIGELAVPEHIKLKPGQLTAEEFERVKVHPVVGADILARVRFPYPVAPLVRSHHERWDGSGYPDGLRGDEIPLGARILAVVDALDATVSDRRYRAGLPFEQALASVTAESGQKYDPDVVAALRKHAQRLERQVAQEQELSTPVLLSPQGAAAGKGSVLPEFLTSIAEARREEKLMQEVTHMLSGSVSLKDTLPVLAHRLRPHIPFDTFVLYARQERVLKVIAATGEHQRHFTGLAVQPGEGLTGWVAEERKPVLNGNASVEPCFRTSAARAATLKTALAVPLDGLNGNAGVLAVYAAARDPFTREHLRVLQSVAAKLAPVVETSLKLHKAETRATVDFLTGLPNAGGLAAHLQNEIARCHRTGEDLAVLVCDLDGFKIVNDRFGHLTGNKILQMVAQGLREHCREYDFVARMGGDEFVVVLPGLGKADIETKRRRFQAVAAQAGLELCGQPVLSLSVGAAYFRADGFTSEELLSLADERMFGRKRAKKLPGAPAPETAFHWSATGSD